MLEWESQKLRGEAGLVRSFTKFTKDDFTNEQSPKKINLYRERARERKRAREREREREKRKKGRERDARSDTSYYTPWCVGTHADTTRLPPIRFALK